jgi:molybdopterin synthase sulfur carrier subunit
LRSCIQGKSEIELKASDVSGCLHELEAQFPAIKEKLWDDEGNLHRYINIYVNGKDVRFLEKLATPLKPGDVVNIVPAIAGG